MRLLYLRAKGFLTIYNGQQADEIEIDFKRSKNKITVIKGPNGSGKSALIEILHPLQDNSSLLVPHMNASKEVHLSHNDIIYKIKHFYELKNDGVSRATTKSYIKKYMNNEFSELNPNGNVGSFKDVVMAEFGLDANFLALSKLSIEDRGIVDKTPSERKKFVAKILADVEAYNDMNKTLTKRESNFRATVNRLLSKIENIGDSDTISSALATLEARINTLMNDKNTLVSKRAEGLAEIKMLDPDGQIVNIYNSYKNDINTINIELDIIEAKIKNMNVSDSDDISKVFLSNKEKIQSLKVDIQILEGSIQQSLASKEAENQELMKRNTRLMTLDNSQDYSTLNSHIRNTKKTIDDYTQWLNDNGYDFNNLLSKEEYLQGVRTLKDLQYSINVIKSSYTETIIQRAIDGIKTNSRPSMDSIQKDIDSTLSILNNYRNELAYQQGLLDKMSALDYRPSGCNIDSCIFISEAVEANSKYSESKMDTLLLEIPALEDRLIQLKELLSDTNAIIDCYNSINQLIRIIQASNSIFRKLPNLENIINIESFCDRFIYTDQFEEISKLYNHVERCDIFDEYKNILELYNNLLSKQEVYKERKSLIDELVNSIEELTSKMEGLDREIQSKRLEISNINLEIRRLDDYNNILENIIDIQAKQKELTNQKGIILSQFYTIQNSMTNINNKTAEIDTLNTKIGIIEKQLPMMLDDRDTLKHSIKLLEEYQADLSIYQEKFEKVSVARNYCGSTEGIQLVFIDMYMNTTLQLANKLLALIFEGRFVLQQYIVNEDEFKMPCIGDGLARDDISSLSLSEKSMMSMIMSVVLLQQSSSKYNVLRLDEVDGPLDAYNRRYYPTLLNTMIDMLGIEQCIVVSHNDEMNLAECDIISLYKEPVEFEGNVIYSPYM